MQTVLLWVIRLVAVGALVPSFFVMWYLAGSDDTPRNPVAPFLGLGVMVAAIWTAASSFQTLVVDPSRAVAIFALPPVLFLVAWPFAGNESEGGRPPLLEYVRDSLWMCGPLLIGALYLAM